MRIKDEPISWCLVISPTHKRTEGRAPVWGSEFTTKDAALQGGGPAETAAKLNLPRRGPLQAEELPRRAARGACAQAVLVKGSLSGPTAPRGAAGHGWAD
jgi:hypothetical protein